MLNRGFFIIVSVQHVRRTMYAHVRRTCALYAVQLICNILKEYLFYNEIFKYS